MLNRYKFILGLKIFLLKVKIFLLLLSFPIIYVHKHPSVGIVTQEISHKVKKYISQDARYKDNNYKLHIASSYVKFVESSGAQVVPIFLDKSEGYYRRVLEDVNGLLIPGGISKLGSGSFYNTLKTLYKIIKEKNKEGEYFPILGICLGMEGLLMLDNSNVNILKPCDAENVLLNINVTVSTSASKMFKNIKTIKNDLQGVAPHFHKKCYAREDLSKNRLTRNWLVTSENKDVDDNLFVSSVEHKRYPFYGLQFHPEKNIFEWKETLNLNKSPSGINASRYFGDFFIKECKKNPNILRDKDLLIYNYDQVPVGKYSCLFESVYVFN